MRRKTNNQWKITDSEIKEKFPHIRDLANYDFKNEAPWDTVKSQEDPIKKFQHYRNENTGKLKFDCDNSGGACKLADSIYETLWGWSYRHRYQMPTQLAANFGHVWDRMGSDTMNSFSTTYNQALKIYGGDKTITDQNQHLSLFASLTHSLGNFTLMPFRIDPEDPKSFNQYRGFNLGKYFVYDYFDLSLKIIKEKIDQDTFEKFIQTFFLTDFVDENYNIIPLIDSHKAPLESIKIDLSNPVAFLPQSENELNQYLHRVNALIQARGQKMIKALEDANYANYGNY